MAIVTWRVGECNTSSNADKGIVSFKGYDFEPDESNYEANYESGVIVNEE